MTAGLRVRLELEDGSTVDIPLDFTEPMTVEQEQQLARLFYGNLGDPALQTAAGVFVRLDRPDEDFQTIGPILVAFFEGDDDILTVEGG